MLRAPSLITACLAVGLLSSCAAADPTVRPGAAASAATATQLAEGDPQARVDVVPPDPLPPWAAPASPVNLPTRTVEEIRTDPALLHDRRLPTADLLPPPRDGKFAATVGPITAAIRERMGESWSEACPVRLADLRYLTVSFRGFDGEPHTGELVVAASVADDVVKVFRQLYAEHFPIEEMRLVNTADHHAPPTGDANNTAAYNCRPARGQKRWSAHAYGLSVDINPFHNPMVRRGNVTPGLATAYADRATVRPGMITPDSPPVRAFRDVGWQWGGDWTYSKDYMHFSVDGS